MEARDAVPGSATTTSPARFASSLRQLALAAGQQRCVDLIWRRGSKALQRSRFLALRVRPAGITPRRLARAAGGQPPVRWLLVEWAADQPEPVK
jgi:hypothetical protein